MHALKLCVCEVVELLQATSSILFLQKQLTNPSNPQHLHLEITWQSKPTGVLSIPKQDTYCCLNINNFIINLFRNVWMYAIRIQ